MVDVVGVADEVGDVRVVTLEQSFQSPLEEDGVIISMKHPLEAAIGEVIWYMQWRHGLQGRIQTGPKKVTVH